jgi:hypothetical protein
MGGRWYVEEAAPERFRARPSPGHEVEVPRTVPGLSPGEKDRELRVAQELERLGLQQSPALLP